MLIKIVCYNSHNTPLLLVVLVLVLLLVLLLLLGLLLLFYSFNTLDEKSYLSPRHKQTCVSRVRST
jgi:hypothetical protein